MKYGFTACRAALVIQYCWLLQLLRDEWLLARTRTALVALLLLLLYE